jgi:hypothetical protein
MAIHGVGTGGAAPDWPQRAPRAAELRGLTPPAKPAAAPAPTADARLSGAASDAPPAHGVRRLLEGNHFHDHARTILELRFGSPIVTEPSPEAPTPDAALLAPEAVVDPPPTEGAEATPTPAEPAAKGGVAPVTVAPAALDEPSTVAQPIVSPDEAIAAALITTLVSGSGS